jgi:hypothetical protein
MRPRRRFSRQRLAVAGLLLALVPSPARATTVFSSVTLTWKAPAGCPSEAEVLIGVARVLDEGRRDRVAVTARVDVERTRPSRWRGLVSLDTADGRGDRVFEAESCAAVASAAALIIAVTAEGAASERAPAEPRPRAPPPAPAAAPSPPMVIQGARATAAPSRPAPRSELMVAAAAVMDVGVMPDGPAGGGEVSLGIGLGRAGWRLRASIGGAYFPAQTTMLAAGGEGGRFALLSLSLRACGLAARGRFEAGPCLGGQLDRMSASGVGSSTLFDAEQASGWWGAGLAGAAASWRLSPLLALFARGEAVLTPAEPRFVLQPGTVVVHTPSRTAGRAALGIELRFF